MSTKPKLLMLHGYRQNEKAFRERTGGLRKSLKSHAEFIFCEAPHQVPKNDIVEEESSTEEDQRGWWFSDENKTYHAQDITNCQVGFEQSLEYIDKIFETQGPFDGVFSFSQGASLASILCRIAQINLTNESFKFRNIKFKFAIIVAGFKSGQTQHDIYYNLEDKIKLPTMHIIGETDKVIPKDMSQLLLDYFLNPKVYNHAGGHFVPVNAEAKNAFIEFFNQVKSN